MKTKLEWYLEGYALSVQLSNHFTNDDLLETVERIREFYKQAVHDKVHLLVDGTRLRSVDKLSSLQNLMAFREQCKLGWVVAYGIADVHQALLGEQIAHHFGFRFHAMRNLDDAVEFLNLYALSLHPELRALD